MSKVFRLQKVEYHSLNRYFSQDINEDELRHIFNRADIDESEHDELLDALENPEHDRNSEAWDILREDDYFNDGWDHDDDDLWTDRKGGYDVEETVQEIVDDGSEGTETLN